MAIDRISKQTLPVFQGISDDESKTFQRKFERLNLSTDGRVKKIEDILAFAKKQTSPQTQQKIISANADEIKRHQKIISRNVHRTSTLALQIVAAKKNFSRQLNLSLKKTGGQADKIIDVYKAHGGENLKYLTAHQKSRFESLQKIVDGIPADKTKYPVVMTLADETSPAATLDKKKNKKNTSLNLDNKRDPSLRVNFKSIDNAFDEDAMRRFILADRSRNFKPESMSYEDWYLKEKRTIQSEYERYETDIARHRSAINKHSTSMESVGDIIERNLKKIRNLAVDQGDIEGRTVRFGERNHVSEIRVPRKTKKAEKKQEVSSCFRSGDTSSGEKIAFSDFNEADAKFSADQSTA